MISASVIFTLFHITLKKSRPWGLDTVFTPRLHARMKKDDPIIMHFGESIGLWKLLGHYRLMARNARFPRDKALYRTLARTAIAQYREERKSA